MSIANVIVVSAQGTIEHNFAYLENDSDSQKRFAEMCRDTITSESEEEERLRIDEAIVKGFFKTPDGKSIYLTHAELHNPGMYIPIEIADGELITFNAISATREQCLDHLLEIIREDIRNTEDPIDTEIETILAEARETIQTKNTFSRAANEYAIVALYV